MSDPFEPRGPLVESFEELQRLISECEAWQWWTGTQAEADPVAASAGHVHLIDLPTPEGQGVGGSRAYTAEQLAALRPFAVVDYPPPEMEDDEAFVSPRHAQGFFVHRGRLNVSIEAAVPDELAGDLKAAKLHFMRRLGALIGDLQALGDTDDRLAVTEIRMWCPPVHSERLQVTTQGEFMTADLVIGWGVSALASAR